MSLLLPTRRGFLLGALATLAAPAIVRASSLMKLPPHDPFQLPPGWRFGEPVTANYGRARGMALYGPGDRPVTAAWRGVSSIEAPALEDTRLMHFLAGRARHDATWGIEQHWRLAERYDVGETPTTVSGPTNHEGRWRSPEYHRERINAAGHIKAFR